MGSSYRKYLMDRLGPLKDTLLWIIPGTLSIFGLLIEMYIWPKKIPFIIACMIFIQIIIAAACIVGFLTDIVDRSYKTMKCTEILDFFWRDYAKD